MTSLSLTTGDGPQHAPSSRPGVGLVSEQPLRYTMSDAESFPEAVEGRPSPLRQAQGGPSSGSGVTVREVDHVVAVGDRLSYAVFPVYEDLGSEVEAGCASTAVALDLVFDDGGRLSDLEVADQHGVTVTAAAQHASKTLVVDQWNLKIVDLTPAAGRHVVAIELAAASTGRESEGWLDAIEIGQRRTAVPAKPTDYVVTTRGTHSSGQFSRGNNAPLAAVPHGFNFISPVTDAGTHRWIYSWHQHNGRGNLPALQGLAFSHIPSPWMGDRAIFQVCPTSQPDVPSGNRETRSLPFDHHDEAARAHSYAVTTQSGLSIELAPTDHAVIMRFTFPDDQAALIFDQMDGNGLLTLGQDEATGRAVVTGYVGTGQARDSILPPMYVYGVLDRAPIASGLLDEPERENVCGYVRVDAGPERTVELRLASSFISIDQALRNLDQELGADLTFDQVRDAAEEQWAERLDRISVDGASEDQLVTLYSNLYRLFLYPNTMHENVGTVDEPRYAYASSFTAPLEPHTPERTGCLVVEGKCSVNNGFWDTYRTCWPALTLLDPERAGELLDGFVQHFRDGGWTARWSSPGYADCMVGTSSDIVLADAFGKDIPGVDFAAGYDSALRNATVPATAQAVGRNGLETAVFTGYVSADTTEGMSWTLESAINDYGIAVWSERLAAEADDDDPRRSEYAANARYFGSRARAYGLMFDDRVGFFQGRTADGEFRLPPDEFDPAVWGHDFTETNGWGMAFSAQHDGNGLAALYGGRDGLEAKLDAFFATPETAGQDVSGTYGRPIHEMTEARTVRMGMLGLTNQPAHHIPYIYLHTDAPHKTQAITRECLGRLWVGSEIGQGYMGDEDNGEMSAWWIFNALGFYPLSLASGEYAITAPLFERAEVRLPGGATIEVIARNQAPENVYIQSLTVDGEPWLDTVVSHERLNAGARLEFELGPEPSTWGRGLAHSPLSITESGVRPAPLTDRTQPDSAALSSTVDDAGLLIDNSSVDSLDLPAGAWVAYELEAAQQIELYTLTAGPDTAPTGWVLEGSDDGQSWTVLDERTDEAFQWQRQTRPFLIAEPAAYPHYRLSLPTGGRLHQWELLGA